jgi:serine phosphatase RsbU (regulator of sigma subunit)/ketosteroid isomerase-like protein
MFSRVRYPQGSGTMSAPDGTNLPEERDMSVEEENKALVRRFVEAQNKGDLETLDELLAPDFVDHNLLPGQAPGREGFMQGVAEDHAAMSYGRTTFEYQTTDGDMVISRITQQTIHDRGAYLGTIAPTGQERETMAMLMHRISRGKIIEEWSANSAAWFLEQLEQEVRERERIEQDLRVARRIQQASLPREVPQLEGWQISPFYQPAREVGGDFYEYFDLDDGRVGLAVGDATGKGVPAAFVMSSTCALLGGVATASGSSPGEVLARVNEAVLARIPPNMFVTCFYAILEPESGTLSYANAGHDLPYLHRNGEAEELRARGMPLGLMPGMSYEEKETILEAGEEALFYSDGLVEAHDPKGEMFGFPRLRKLVAEHGEEGSLVSSLLEELYSFTGEGWEQEDDITLVTLRHSAARS